LDHVPQLIALLDDRNFVSYGNKAFTHLFRDVRDEPIPLFSLLSLPPLEARTLETAIEQARLSGFAATSLQYRPSETTEPLEFDVWLARASDIRETPHVVVSLQDVTRFHQNTRGLLRARRVDLLGRLTGSYVHDLNNLLFVVRSGTDLAALALPEDHETQSDLKAIRDAANQAATLSSEMLALSRPTNATESSCSPTETIRTIEKSLRRLTGRHITLDLDLSPESLIIGIPAIDWQQIVLNLVLNASQALGREGKIRIAVTNETTDTVLLTVEDNGPGIPSEYQQQLFEPFFTTNSTQGRVGLGLSTVKSIVESAGGRIEIETSSDSGTRIIVRLPKVKENRMSSNTPSVPPNGNDARLLVLDDEDQVRRLMVRLLTREGYHVDEAATLRSALEKAKETARLDVWVTDANVGGTDATSAISEMRRMHPNVAIVLVSGREPDDEQMEILQNEGVTFLAKPFTPAELRQSIDQAYRHGLATSTVVPLASESASLSDRLVR
jgi:signal transduction histidine kinase/CheY-like chemotaxis protein